VALLKERGYTLKNAMAADLFPRCAHVESIVCLVRERTVHSMNLNPAPFEMIKSGEKTIELRLWDEKRQMINPGDTIIFTNTATGETLSKTVVKLHRFENFEELYRALPLLQCGYTESDIHTASPDHMAQYYSAEQQSQYGVVGIELCG
jgi:ASC-1-like (ASCH) protein